MFTATLFDYNGVLVDDELVHLAAFQDVLTPLGIALERKTYWREYLGLDDEGVFETVLRASGKTPAAGEVQALIEAKVPCYLRRAETALSGFEGAANLVAAQASQGPVAIVSGALNHEIELGLKVLGIRNYVSSIIAAEHTKRSKPDPEGYLLGLAFLEAQGVTQAAKNTVVFEDSLDGIQAAKGAGLTCVAIAHTYPMAELLSSDADACISKVGDIDQQLLERVFAETR